MRIAICDDSLWEQKQLLDALEIWDSTCVPLCFNNGTELLAAAAGRKPHRIPG